MGRPPSSRPPALPRPDLPQNALPDVLAVVQVALEGTISKRSAQASLAAGQLPQVRGAPRGRRARRGAGRGKPCPLTQPPRPPPPPRRRAT